MVDLSSKKRMAAEVLGVGISRVRFHPDRLDDIADAITRASMRSLAKEGVVWVEPVRGVPRGRTRIRHGKRRTRNAGSKEGAKGARLSRKTRWILRVRPLRRHLKMLKDRGDITNLAFRTLYRQVKGGEVRSLRHLRELVKEHVRG